MHQFSYFSANLYDCGGRKIVAGPNKTVLLLAEAIRKVRWGQGLRLPRPQSVPSNLHTHRSNGSKMTPTELMQLAIEKCREGIAAGQSPFGCAIECGGRVIACSHNTVVATTDITAHAEVNALREACHAIGNIFLDGAVVATTCEPCPMCMAALHWARVGTVYYGATIADADDAGFNELSLPAAELLRIGGSTLELVPELMQPECKQLFAEWKANPRRTVY